MSRNMLGLWTYAVRNTMLYFFLLAVIFDEVMFDILWGCDVLLDVPLDCSLGLYFNDNGYPRLPSWSILTTYCTNRHNSCVQCINCMWELLHPIYSTVLQHWSGNFPSCSGSYLPQGVCCGRHFSGRRRRSQAEVQRWLFNNFLFLFDGCT